MSEWVTVAAVSELAEGEHKVVDIDGEDVVLIKQNNAFYALADVCTHDGGDISSGVIEGDDIICPRHGARFCIKTGKVTAPPAYEDVSCYAVRIVDGLVQIENT
ncbi:MAG: non-heme iron oxygenase ferredoxin subunit [Methylococcales bacterium]|nr:non-heme iron oxygenase ferredoxin subunit [Methylococcales bacterium]